MTAGTAKMSTDEQAANTLIPDDHAVDDAAIGDDQSSFTASLRSSLYDSVKENGRGYHRYKSTAGGEYPLPDDDQELDRLELQHEMFLYAYNNKLHHSPLGSQVGRVLDLGTGTGSWVGVLQSHLISGIVLTVASHRVGHRFRRRAS